MEPAELRERRRMLHLSQAKLGVALGVPANTIARWERGELEIKHPKLVATALDRLSEESGAVAGPAEVASPAEAQHNLPAEVSSLVGRDRQVIDLLQVLGTTRALTLTGPGGVGKTRLSLRLARELLPHQPGGVWFVDFAPIVSGSLVAATLAEACGVRQQPGEAILKTLTGAIGQQKMVLVLDNCEHVVRESAELADALLRACPNVTIVATSRERLRIPGEVNWPVAPLGLPDADPEATLEVVLRSDAVQLFVERARGVAPDFTLTSENSAVVAQICVRLDGVPLALELAAARLNVLDPDQIRTHLDNRFSLLARGPRTAQLRQQSVRNTLDWSFELLGDSERTVFSRLAVFTGEWGLDAAEFVCANDGLEPGEVLDALTSLVDKSLLAVSRQTPRRFRMLETVRAYATLQLEASGEADRVRARSAAFAVDLVERLGTVVSASGSDASAALEQLKWNMDILRAALRWTIDSGAANLALRLAGALTEVWYRLGAFEEGSAWLSQVLALPQASAPTFERAWAATGAGWLAVCQGQYADGWALNEEALVIGRALDDPLLVSRALLNLGVSALLHGEYDSSRQLLEEALAFTRRNGDRMGEAMMLGNLGWLAVEIADYDTAEACGDERVGLGQSVDSLWVTAIGRVRLGQAAFGKGQIARARSLLEQSLTDARAVGDRTFVARSLEALGNVVLVQGDALYAGALLKESLQLRYELGDVPGIVTSLESIAGASASCGVMQKAVYLLGAAAGLRGALQMPQSPRQRAVVERWLPAVRRGVGEAAFETAWVTGQSAPLTTVVANALSQDAPLVPIASNPARLPHRPDPLTPREREVAALVARGLTNRMIAAELVVTEATVAKHIEHILAKLGFSSRVEIGVRMAALDTRADG